MAISKKELAKTAALEQAIMDKLKARVSKDMDEH